MEKYLGQSFPSLTNLTKLKPHGALYVGPQGILTNIVQILR